MTFKTLFFSVAWLLLSACSALAGVVSVINGKDISTKQLLDELENARVVFVGESHTAKQHHQFQLQILKGLKERGRLVAVGMEMFESGSQPALDSWSAGGETGSFIKAYHHDWGGEPYELYQGIFNYVRSERIALIGLNAPLEVVRKVGRSGQSSLARSELDRLPPEIELTVADDYLKFMAGIFIGHAFGKERLQQLCEAQMLRNRTMAHNINQYLAKNPDRILLVFTGAAHARLRGGIPAELGEVDFRILLPPMPGIDRHAPYSGDVDYYFD